MQSRAMKLIQGVSVWEGAEEVQSIIHIKAEKCKNMKHSQDMQLIQKLRDDQKCMKKVFEVMSGRNIVTNSRVTPSWREIVSLTFSEAGVLHVNWISFGHCVLRRVYGNIEDLHLHFLHHADSYKISVTSGAFRFILGFVSLDCLHQWSSVLAYRIDKADLVSWVDQERIVREYTRHLPHRALLNAITG
ncbi:hypothetical protein Tco_0151458 [Tanacetum coccineum]